jgi:ribosomal 30S subunit maturation factor RimM
MVFKYSFINIGKIYREHGVKGFCKLALLPGRGGADLRPGLICRLARADGQRLETAVLETARMGRLLVVRWEAFTAPEQIQPWRQALVWIAERARRRARGEIFDDEWVGFTLLNAQGLEVGRVRDVVYNPLRQFVVERATGRGELRVPCVEEWFLKLERKKKRLTLAVPEGLTEL